MAGTMFFLCIIFWYLIFGGSFNSIGDLLGGDKSLLPLVGLFFSTPVLGLIISTLTFSYMYKYHRRKVHYYVPDDKKIINHIFREYPNLNKTIKSKNSDKWDIKQVDEFYPYYQTQVRRFIQGGTLEYLERRWASYWTHRNAITAIIISFVTVFIYNIPRFKNLEPNITIYKFCGFAFLVAYFFLSIHQAKRARKDGCNFEYIWLRKEISKIKAHEKHRTNKNL
jgi:hypothetical protein